MLSMHTVLMYNAYNVYRVTDARGKFGEHEKSVRVARGAAESNSSFLIALQTSQVHPSLDIRAAKTMNQFFYNIAAKTSAQKRVLFVIECKIALAGWLVKMSVNTKGKIWKFFAS